MQNLDWTLGIVMVVSSLGIAMLALLVMAYLAPPRRIVWTPLERLGDPVAFMFRDRALVDATSDARTLLETGPEFLDDWPRTVAILEPRFPGFAEEIGGLAERQHLLLKDETSGDELEAEWRGGLARIVLRESRHDHDAPDQDRFSQAALSEELAILRSVIDDAPMLVWKEDAAGAVRWANGAYVDLAERSMTDGQNVGWPLPRVFEDRPIGPGTGALPRRLSVMLPDADAPLWFDTFDEKQGEETIVFALPADRLVRAEASLREFVQTLTKTFAHLPTGLAVFDRDRRLALFNPALTDLSALPPQFLSGRPSLFDFLDKLREKQRMPEPKNYKGWRQQMLELENAAASGTYQETWSLPTGQTFCVTGRPHPDGAIAFLFEDISAEISLTRHFRAELDLGQSVLDSLDEGIAVFSASGRLMMFNAAYTRMWEHDPSDTLGDISIIDATRHWQEHCAPSPVWGDLRQFAEGREERADWSAEIPRNDGTVLAGRFVPLPGHATLVGFTDLSLGHQPAAKLWTRMPAALR